MTDTLDKPEWSALIPHQGAMCLLDSVLSWDDKHVHALTVSHRAADNPLRNDDQLRAVHLCEYGAQAMALHGALLQQVRAGKVRPGMLVALRDVHLHVTRIDDLPEPLYVIAEKLLDTGASWHYRFSITHGGVLLAEGRATVALGDNGKAANR